MKILIIGNGGREHAIGRKLAASPKKPMIEEFYIINESYKTIHFRHGGLANILFVDGHVEVFKPYPGTTDKRVRGEITGRITPRSPGCSRRRMRASASRC